MTNLLSLIFDGGLAVLLIVTIGYCRGLSKRIRLLQDSRGELAGMITQFDQATTKAMTSLAELQTVAKRITDALQLKIEKANFLADDLAFLIEKSGKLATQLETARSAVATPELVKPKPAVSQTQPYAQAASVTPPKPKLGIWPPPQKPEAEKPGTPAAVLSSVASLEALLSSLGAGSREDAPAKPSAPKPQPQLTPRTDAERELMEALKGR